MTIKLTSKLDLKIGEKVIASSNLTNMEWLIWIAWSIVFCIRYSRLFQCILEKHGEDIDKPSAQKYVKKMKIGLHLKLKMDIVLNF